MVMLTTLATIREALEIPVAEVDAQMDANLTRYILAISAAIETYCDRLFELAAYDVRLEGKDRKKMSLPQWPVVTVTEIKHGDDILTTSDYRLDANAGMIEKVTGTWTEDVNAKFTAGYVLPPDPDRNLPYDIEHACLLWAMLQYNTINKAGIKSERIDDIAVNYESPFAVSVSTGGKIFPAPPTVMAMLNSYRRMKP